MPIYLSSTFCLTLQYASFRICTMVKKQRPKLRDVILALGREQRDYVKSLRAKGMTYQAIGDELGLTRERIRQILNRAKLDEA